MRLKYVVLAIMVQCKSCVWLCSASLIRVASVERPAEDGSEKIGIQSFALASALCPVLAELCIKEMSFISEAVLRIISAASVCAENDIMDQPVQVVDALNRIAGQVQEETLHQFLLSDRGLRVVPILVCIVYCFVLGEETDQTIETFESCMGPHNLPLGISQLADANQNPG